MKIPKALWGLTKEVARHLLKRPVIGLCAFAKTDDGRILLIRRGDSGQWAMPGGTLEWGETLRSTLDRELFEEAGVQVKQAGELLAVYSDPKRDPRFHAVTVVVGALVSEPQQPPMNPLEITEVKLFAPDQLPPELSHGMTDMMQRLKAQQRHWE